MAKKPTSKYRFEVFKSNKDKKFYWHLIAIHGGKVVAQSEGYSRRTNAMETVNSLAGQFKAAPKIEII